MSKAISTGLTRPLAGRVLRRLPAVFLFLALVGTALCWFAGSRLIAPFSHAVPLPGDVPARTVTLELAEGRSVVGWFLPGEGKGAVLLLHGIRADRRQMLGRARFLNRQGYAVLLVDLPGHGESVAPAITFGLREADGVDAALRHLRTVAPGQPVGVIGVSLGSASFMLCRRCPQVDAVVLESMYPTITEAVEDRLRMRVGPLADVLSPLLLWQLPLRLDIMPQQLRPIDAMVGLHTPVLVAAGDEDRHTTIEETRRLVAAAREPKQSWEVRGAAHVDLHDFAPSAYEERIGPFLAEAFAHRGVQDRGGGGCPARSPGRDGAACRQAALNTFAVREYLTVGFPGRKPSS